MISAYDRDQRQPTLGTLLRLLRAAGLDLRLHLAARDPHDDILARLEASRTEAERQARDRQLQPDATTAYTIERHIQLDRLDGSCRSSTRIGQTD